MIWKTGMTVILLAAVPSASWPREKVHQPDRSILKEPNYKTEPRYALLLFGSAGKQQMMLVQDGDVLYVDRNANRDLTEKDERIEGKRDTVGRYGKQRHRTVFVVGGITGANREKLGFVYEYYRDRTLYDFFHLYRGFQPKPYSYGKVIQGLPGDAQGDFQFSRKRETCPVYHFQGPLTIRRIGNESFVPGQEDESLSVRIGTPGIGQGSFAAIEHDCVPKNVHPKAVIVFQNCTDPKVPIRLTLILKKRC